MNMSEPKLFNQCALRGELRHNVPMSKHTSWRAGGVAERMYQPADLADLQVFLRSLPVDEPLYVAGLGSNLLVRDGGVHGTVLLMHGALKELRLESEHSVYVEAGVAGAKLARFAATHHLSGAAFFAGIPGTVGGMLAMNAGCYGSETWQKVQRVLVVNRRGELFQRSAEDYEISYRHVVARGTQEEWFVAAWLKFEAGDSDTARQEIKTLLNKRIATQPLNLPNAGSVFRNPPNDYAARLIELCGLKGKQIGGAQVSEKHANFIVNVGGATAADIENLINQVQVVVQQKLGVALQCEVRLVGEKHV
ncbi:MAG: UDP-N-acetylmuramate dehydrogenase [Gallionella sp.]